MINDAIDHILEEANISEESAKYIRDALVEELDKRIMCINIKHAVNAKMDLTEVQAVKDKMQLVLFETIDKLIKENDKAIFTIEKDVEVGTQVCLRFPLFKIT